MKSVPVKNHAKAKIVVRAILDDDGLPLQFPADKVTPTLEKHLEHPALKRYFENGLLALEGEKPAKKKAAQAPAPKKPETPPPPPPEDPPEEDPDEEEEDELRELYLDAPGITESNVDAVLEKYPTLDELISADEDDLLDCGVSKSFVKRVLEWAAS
jgi:hypothetical protein